MQLLSGCRPSLPGKQQHGKLATTTGLQLKWTLGFPSPPPVSGMPQVRSQQENIDAQFSGGYYKKADFCKQLYSRRYFLNTNLWTLSDGQNRVHFSPVGKKEIMEAIS